MITSDVQNLTRPSVFFLTLARTPIGDPFWAQRSQHKNRKTLTFNNTFIQSSNCSWPTCHKQKWNMSNEKVPVMIKRSCLIFPVGFGCKIAIKNQSKDFTRTGFESKSHPAHPSAPVFWINIFAMFPAFVVFSPLPRFNFFCLSRTITDCLHRFCSRLCRFWFGQNLVAIFYLPISAENIPQHNTL